jgi:hypothetical protein
MKMLPSIAGIFASFVITLSLTAADEAPKAVERAPKGQEKVKQLEKYDQDKDTKLDPKEKGKVQQDKAKLLREVRPQREAELTAEQREAEKAKLKERKEKAK